MTDITSVIDLVTKGGLISALIIALVGGMRGWYVWGNVHAAALKALQDTLDKTRVEKDEQIKTIITDNGEQIRRLVLDRDYWREMAIRSMTNTGRLTDVFEASRKPE